MKSENNLQTEAYGARLAAAREAMGLSQAEAGKRLSKARETLSLIERGVFAYAPNPREMQEYDALYGFPQVEQLSILGYEVTPLVLEGLPNPTAEELGVLNTFRRLDGDLRFLLRLMLNSLTEAMHGRGSSQT